MSTLDPAQLARIKPWMDRWIDSGRIPGLSVAIHHRGATAYFAASGQADRERALPMAEDTVVRLYSMTKPITSLALLMLYEEGRFQLDDSIAAILPAFAHMQVQAGENTVPADRAITYRDLLTHTAGLTYGFMQATPVDALYREHGIDFQTAGATLTEIVDRLATLPLLAQPGTAWNYSVATDVIGHLVALHSGMPFDAFLQTRILAPLDMHDTGFHVRKNQRARFAANYAPGQDGQATLLDDPETSRFLTPRMPSGGGGLVGTAPDYMRFCRLLLGRGSLGPIRLIGRKTAELMMANHLGGDMAAMGQARFSESSYAGIGFGLGLSVMIDPARAQILGTPGEVAWGGAASTAFWVDPAEDLAVILLAQLTPSSTHPIRRELRVLTYAALT